MILESFPSAEDFYKHYWNKAPFIVRGAVPAPLFDRLIDAESLAGLSLEEDIKSRIVVTSPDGDAWDCTHGPFAEDKFSTLGESHWSLLVQNVEQYHEETAELLNHFEFSPRWLMDDVMVSYSTKGGSVGAHTDSYHVFLVQGSGVREWKVSHEPITHGEHVADIELQVLKNGFEGESVRVETGDVIYLPPHFAHEGVTIEDAMTFSVGFLGPKLSELMIEYGYYLEQTEKNNPRYSGEGLGTDCRGTTPPSAAVENIRSNLAATIGSDDFSTWLAAYFSKSPDDEYC